MAAPPISPLPFSHAPLKHHGYSVKFSPFPHPNGYRLAVAASQHFGIVGNGGLYILQLQPNGAMAQVAMFDTLNSLFDVSWSEQHERHVIASCGDGSVKLFDVEAQTGRPLRVFHEHQQEVYSVQWNQKVGDTFLSASWDQTIKLWSPDSLQSLGTWAGHEYCIHSVCWDPSSPSRFLSASGDGTLKIWDRGMPGPASTIIAHQNEVLCCDWNKYDEFIIASGSVDRTIKVWDIRKGSAPMDTLHGHNFGVRRICFSPHNESIIASCSYDMTVCLWDIVKPDSPLIARADKHSEFVVGLDFNMFEENMLASCGWDENVFVWKM